VCNIDKGLNMARYRKQRKHETYNNRSRKVNKREIYSAVYKSRKSRNGANKRKVITGGATPVYSMQKPSQSKSTSWTPKIGFTDRARVLGAEITHKVKVAGREIVDKLTIGSPLKTKIKNFKNAYSAFRLQSMKFDLQVKEMINYFNGTINAKLLTPISAGTVAGGIFSKKPTKPIITVSDASMASSLSNKFLYRLANIRDIPTQNFLDRCSMGSIKKNIAKVKNAVTLKVIRKHTSDKMNNFDRYGEPQYRFLLCRIYNYRVAEIAYNNAYQSLVTVTMQVLNDPALTGIIKLPGNMYSKTRYNGIRYFDTSQTPITQLDKQVDTLVNQLNKLITPGDKPMDKKADFIPGKILKTLTKPLDKITKSITWIVTNALYHAKRVDITRKLFYNLTNIRPTDELTYTPKEYTNWFLSASQKDKESKASDRREFITRLNQLNLRIQELANAIKPSVERLIKNEMNDIDSELDVKEEQIKALEYAYRYFNKPGRQSIDVGMALEAMGADPTLILHGAKPTLSTVIERIRSRINELKGIHTESTGPATKVEEENEMGESSDEEFMFEMDNKGSSRASGPVSPESKPSSPGSVPLSPESKPSSPDSVSSSPESKPSSPGSVPLSPESKPSSPGSVSSSPESKPSSLSSTAPSAESKPSSLSSTAPSAESKPGSLSINATLRLAKFIPPTKLDENDVTSHITGGPVRNTPEKAAASALSGMQPGPNNRNRNPMKGGAIFDEYLTPSSKTDDYEKISINGYSYINITETGLQNIQSIILFLLQRPFFIADKTLLERGKMAKQGDKPYESISFKTTYYNYLAKLDMGVTEFDIQQESVPVIFPDTTIRNNLPGFVSTYLYRQFYALSPEVNYSDLCLIDLKVLDTLTQKETGRTQEEMIANKHYVYQAKSIGDKDKEQILELFGDAAKQGTHITIPPSFLQYALLTPAELAQLLKMADNYLNKPGMTVGLDLGDLRDRVNKQTLNPGKMADLKVLMDDAGILIIRDIYERLSVYMKNSPVISQDTKDDSVLRAAFDNCLSKIMLFLKLNHLFGDFIKFKKFMAKDEKNDAKKSGKATENKTEKITVTSFLQEISSKSKETSETDSDDMPADLIAFILLKIGMDAEINDMDDLHNMFEDLLKQIDSDEEDEEEEEEEKEEDALSTRFAPPARSTTKPLTGPAAPAKSATTAKSAAIPVAPAAKPAAPTAKPEPPAAEHVAPSANAVKHDTYCVYPITTLDIAKKIIDVSNTGKVNLQVEPGFSLKANDIIRLPLTDNSEVYTLARPGDISTPYTATGPVSKLSKDTIKLPGGVTGAGLYIVIYGKKSDCKPAYSKLVELKNMFKFEDTGIGKSFRVITDNKDDLPKTISASVASPVSSLTGPVSNALSNRKLIGPSN